MWISIDGEGIYTRTVPQITEHSRLVAVYCPKCYLQTFMYTTREEALHYWRTHIYDLDATTFTRDCAAQRRAEQARRIEAFRIRNNCDL